MTLLVNNEPSFVTVINHSQHPTFWELPGRRLGGRNFTGESMSILGQSKKKDVCERRSHRLV